MSQGIVKRIQTSKSDAAVLLIKLSGGAVYEYQTRLRPHQQTLVIAGLTRTKGKVKLQYWRKVS